MFSQIHLVFHLKILYMKILGKRFTLVPFILVYFLFIRLNGQEVSRPTEQYDGFTAPHGSLNDLSGMEEIHNSNSPFIGRSIFDKPVDQAFSSLHDRQISLLSSFDNKGKEFWLCFQQNYDNVSYPLSLKLFLTSDVNTSATVSIPALSWESSVSVTANAIMTVEIPDPLSIVVSSSETVEARGVHVVADEPITVYALNQMTYSTDAYLSLPIDILNVSYLVMSYTSATSDINQSQFTIVSPYNNVDVIIIPSSGTEGGHSAGQPFYVTLNQGDVYQVQAYAADDLTGTLVESSLPIAMFAGNSCSTIPIGTGYCDHIVEQLPPINTWGSNFVGYPLEGRMHGDTWRILSSQDNTQLYINDVLVTTLSFADFYETVLEEPSIIQTNHPVLVMQYSNGDNWDSDVPNNGDPFMMMVPPVEQYMDQYTFATPSSGFSLNYFNVIVRTDGIASLLFDGGPIDAGLFQPIGDINSIEYSGVGIEIATGSHHIQSTFEIPFGIYSYGFDETDSYGYPGGLSLEYIYEGSGPDIIRTPETIELSNTSQSENVPLIISATVTDTISPLVQSAALFYRVISDANYTEAAMAEGNDNIWSAQIPGNAVVDPGVEYYLYATDGQLSSTDPEIDPILNPYCIAVGTNQLPLIEHTPILYASPDTDILISAVITDTTLYLDTAELRYRVAGGNPVYHAVSMTLQNDNYEAIIPASDVHLGQLEYYLRAIDNYGVSAFHGTSNDPHIIQVTDRLLSLITPEESATWIAGTTEDITWISSGVDRVGIKYSIDNGQKWTNIEDNVLADLESYSWQVPSVISEECKMQIYDQVDTTFYSESGLFRITNASIPIYPSMAPSQVAGAEFWVDITIGESGAEVTDLYGASFIVVYDSNYLTPDSTSITLGSFIDPSAVHFVGPIHGGDSLFLAVTHTDTPGVSGSGNILRIPFLLDSATPDIELCIQILEAQANDPNWNPIPLTERDSCFQVVPWVVVWPGDTDNNGIVDQADLLPIGLSWGKTGYPRDYPNPYEWTSQPCRPWDEDVRYTYADANGDSVVNENDISAIHLNWDSTHTSVQSLFRNSDTKLMICRQGGLVYLQTREVAHNQYEIDVCIREADDVLSMGIALGYPEGVEIQAVSGGGIWNRGPLYIHHDDADINRLGIGIGHIRKYGGVSGQGCIAKIRVGATYSDLINEIEITEIKGIDGSGHLLTFDEQTSIQSESDQESTLPNQYAFHPNYPNPFNPRTTLSFELPGQSLVTITVFDVLGNEVKCLFHSEKPAGRYQVEWDGCSRLGKQVSSGIYYFLFKADDFVQVHKGLLMK